MRHLLAIAAPLAVVAAPVSAQSDDQVPASAQQGTRTGVELFTGIEYQEIDLQGGETLEKVAVPLSARVTTGRLRLTGQLPFVQVSGPGNVAPPSGPLGLPILVDPATPSARTTRSGIGDLRLGASYDLGVPGVAIALRTGAKLPTASQAKGLGTGEPDYWAGADLAKPLGRVTPFAGVTYTRTGDPEGFKIKDTLSGQAGAALNLGGAVSAHLGYSYGEAASESFASEQRIFGGLNTPVAGRVSLGVYGSAGVAGASDVGAGLSLGIGLR